MTYTTGAATNSKNPDRYAEGAPRTISRAKGAWVSEGPGAKPYVDLTSGLGAVIFGHADDRITIRVADQLQRGVAYPLPSELEEEVARQLCDFLPWLGAEQVRFSKNGRDAVVAAVRLARAVTGRNRVLYCDYHGSDDMFLSFLPWNAGVSPQDAFKVTRAQLLTESLRDAACVVLEPVSSNAPEDPHGQEFFAQLRKACDRDGTMMILDEMISFGRTFGGSAVSLWGIEPDLWVGGKCIANGMPLTAVVGPRRHMERFGKDVFHSMTHAGETLSLAAASATLLHLKTGTDAHWPSLAGEEVIRLFRECGAEGRLRYVYPSRLLFDFTRDELGILLANGVLCAGYANFTVAHYADVHARAAITEAFRAVLRR